MLYLQDLPIELKRKNDSKKMCISRLASEFPEDCKFYPADAKDELHKVLCLPFRHICIYFFLSPYSPMKFMIIRNKIPFDAMCMMPFTICKTYPDTPHIVILSFCYSSCGYLRSKG